MKNKKSMIGAALMAAVLVTSAGSCTNDEYEEREKVQDAKRTASGLDKTNLERKAEMEAKPDQIGYLYLMSFAQPIGYYVIKGKVSSSGGQLTPEQDIVCRYNTGESCLAVDGPFDDGTYGEREPGIFFFTVDGAFVHSSLDYIYSTVPIPIDVPRFSAEG